MFVIQLLHLMFTCAAPVTAPSRPLLAIQTLLSVSFTKDPDADADAANDNDRVSHWSRYQKACAQLLAVFSYAGEQSDDADPVLDPAENRDYQTLVTGISSSLLIMLDALLSGDSTQVSYTIVAQ